MFSLIGKKPVLYSSFQREAVLVAFFYLFIALVLLAPIASNTYLPNTGDYINHVAAIVQANQALTQGQFPLRIAPLEHHAWGYALYQFYAPTPYTLTALIYRWLTPWNPYIAFKITLITALTLGGFFFYRLTDWLFKSKPTALLTGVVYLFSPYFITIIDNWGGFNEVIALGIVPVVLYYTLRCCLEENYFPYFFKIALGWFFIATSHSITFVYFSLFIGLFLFLLAFYKQFHWKKLIIIGATYSYGCLLALWFLAPIISMGNQMEIATTLASPGSYNHLVPLSALLTVKFVSPTLKINPLKPSINPAFGWPVLLSVGICFYAILKKEILKLPQMPLLPHLLLVLFAIAFFMIWSPLNIWPLLPSFLSIGQYCWRLLNQSLWIGALLFACASYQLFQRRIDARYVVMGLLCIGLASGSWLPSLMRYPTPIDEFVKHPLLGFSHSDYMLSANHIPVILNETSLANLVDKQNHLKKDFVTVVPSNLLSAYPSLTLIIKGFIPKNTLTQSNTFHVFINHQETNRFKLVPGPFQWIIPTAPWNPKAQEPTFQIQFKTDQPVTLSVEKLAFTRFDPSLNIMDVKITDTYCQHVGVDTFCKIPVKNSTNLLELPLLYYPDMLEITLNNQPIEYKPILYQDFVLTAIKPIPNQINIIHARFVGYVWANRISLLAWLGVVVSLLTFQISRNPYGKK